MHDDTVASASRCNEIQAPLIGCIWISDIWHELCTELYDAPAYDIIAFFVVRNVLHPRDPIVVDCNTCVDCA